MSQLKALSVVSEIYPLVKTGGLADVAGVLPGALRAEGVEMRTLVPGYPAVMAALKTAEEAHGFPDLFGGAARLLGGRAGGLDLFVLDAPHLYARPGGPYVSPDGGDWPDNAFRFAALAKAGADIGLGLVPAFMPDIVHGHDWQAGLTPAYLHYSGRPRPGAVMTIHNLAFPGQFPADLLGALGLPPESFTLEGLEYYGSISYLKAGLQLADRITTVSPTYAAEIQRQDMGMGFDGMLRARASRLGGILNGIDVDVWNPASDPLIAAHYDVTEFDGRAANKAALQEALGLRPEPGTLVAGVISRLSWQKGLDLLLDALPVLLGENMQLALLGAGDSELEARFRAAAEAHPGQVGVRIGYDETLAHRIQAGCDALLVPSRYEPCGLTQLCALRYGAVPVGARVGGLGDTIVDVAIAPGGATGVLFSPVTSEALAGALRRTASLFRNAVAWRRMQINGMTTDVSWRGPARSYATLYRELVAARTA
jgi:starch synthase